MNITLPWLKKGRAKAGRVGVYVGPSGLAVASIGQRGTLQHCRFYLSSAQAGQSLSMQEQLAEVVSSAGLKDMPCSLALHPEYYQLLLADAPAVAAEEMSQAVRWKIKDLLDYPIDEAAVEHFGLPADAYRGQRNMLYAAALRKTELQNLVSPIEQVGLAVDCVEIVELALHNLVARLPTEPGGVALLQLNERVGVINLVEEGSIYLSRRLDVGLEQFNPVADNSQFFDALFLEVQRSLDFYESQLGKGIITQLWYSPGLSYTSEIGAFLSAQLGLNVSALDLSPLRLADVIDEELDEQMSLCAVAIGAALGPATASEMQATAEEVKESAHAAS